MAPEAVEAHLGIMFELGVCLSCQRVSSGGFDASRSNRQNFWHGFGAAAGGAVRHYEAADACVFWASKFCTL